MAAPHRTRRRKNDGRPTRSLLQKGHQEVFFHMETTGANPRSDHITKISAVRWGGGPFIRFVQPKVAISSYVSNLTGITCINGMMYMRGEPVESESLKDSLDAFFLFLGNDPCTLIAHQALFFAKFLWQAATSTGRIDELKKRVVGFLDSLQLVQKRFPSLPCKYGLPGLVKHFLHESYERHDNVLFLRKLLHEIDWFGKQPSTFSLDYVGESVEFQQSRQGQGDKSSRGGMQQRGREDSQGHNTIDQGQGGVQGSNIENQSQGDSQRYNDQSQMQRGNRGNRRSYRRGGNRGRNTGQQCQGVVQGDNLDQGDSQRNNHQSQVQRGNRGNRRNYGRGGYRGRNTGQQSQGVVQGGDIGQDDSPGFNDQSQVQRDNRGNRRSYGRGGYRGRNTGQQSQGVLQGGDIGQGDSQGYNDQSQVQRGNQEYWGRSYVRGGYRGGNQGYRGGNQRYRGGNQRYRDGNQGHSSGDVRQDLREDP